MIMYNKYYIVIGSNSINYGIFNSRTWAEDAINDNLDFGNHVGGLSILEVELQPHKIFARLAANSQLYDVIINDFCESETGIIISVSESCNTLKNTHAYKSYHYNGETPFPKTASKQPQTNVNYLIEPRSMA